MGRTYGAFPIIYAGTRNKCTAVPGTVRTSLDECLRLCSTPDKWLLSITLHQRISDRNSRLDGAVCLKLHHLPMLLYYSNGLAWQSFRPPTVFLLHINTPSAVLHPLLIFHFQSAHRIPRWRSRYGSCRNP